MSNLTITILFSAILLIILALIMEVEFFMGGSGVFFVAGLVYSYIVAKREAQLLSFAVKNRGD